MDKFIGRLTFGFLLGQAAPGFILMVVLWDLGYIDFGSLLASQASATSGSPPWLALLVTGSLVGVVIDQIGWATGGWLMAKETEGTLPSEYFENFNSLAIVLLGPVLVAGLALYALLFSKVKDLNVREFLPRISSEKFAQWEWLQSFYLYTAQFFMNAALAGTLAILPIWIATEQIAWTLALWTGIGLLKLMEMRASSTLFAAESELVDEP